MATDRLWWQGLARIMEGKGLLREGDDKVFLACSTVQAHYIAISSPFFHVYIWREI